MDHLHHPLCDPLWVWVRLFQLPTDDGFWTVVAHLVGHGDDSSHELVLRDPRRSPLLLFWCHGFLPLLFFVVVLEEKEEFEFRFVAKILGRKIKIPTPSSLFLKDT